MAKIAFDKLLQEWNKSEKNLEEIGRLIGEVNNSLTRNSEHLIMPIGITDFSAEVRQIEKKTLEISVLAACMKRDIQLFPIVMAQLYDYYDNLTPVSDNEYEMIGLNLMYLLTQNKLREFHVELERLPTKVRSENAYILMPIQLEQYLMEGTYNKIFLSKTNMPSQYYPYFMDVLLTTVRDEIANCMEKAYKTLSTKEAARLLFFDEKNAEKDVLEYGKKKGWKLSGGNFCFAPEKDKSEENVLRTRPMVGQLIDYAKQLETIV